MDMNDLLRNEGYWANVRERVAFLREVQAAMRRSAEMHENARYDRAKMKMENDMATQLHGVIEDMQKHHSHMVIPTAYIPVLADVHGRLRGVVMMLELEQQRGGGDG